MTQTTMRVLALPAAAVWAVQALVSLAALRLPQVLDVMEAERCRLQVASERYVAYVGAQHVHQTSCGQRIPTQVRAVAALPSRENHVLQATRVPQRRALSSDGHGQRPMRTGDPSHDGRLHARSSAEIGRWASVHGV